MNPTRWFLLLVVAVVLTDVSIAEAGHPPRPRRMVAQPEVVPYYGDTFYKRVRAGERDQSLKNTLRIVLEAAHTPRPGTFDTLTKACGAAENGCYQHHAIGYDTARNILMRQLFAEQRGSQIVVRDVYCEKDYNVRNLPSSRGANAMVSGGVNTEHTWPQSKFTSRYPKELQKSDLHHLFPTNTHMNSARSSFKFAEVDQSVTALPCPIAKLGRVNGQGEIYFEPPVAHKGNVARALFYFSVRYALSIDPEEEAFLRNWNQMDPPDEDEIERNNEIMTIQGNRNPFVDHPQLADRISDF